MKYRVIEHTADAGIEAWGDTLNELFENTALGMMSLMVDPASVELDLEVEAELSGDDLEELMFEWLNHLLFLVEAEGLLFGRFQAEVGEGCLQARAWGERHDPEKRNLGTQVKAATYHQMAVERAGSGWHARVIFDL